MNCYAQFSSSADKKFLIAINADAEDLHSKYNDMLQRGNKWESYAFHKSTLFAASLNSLRTHIEFKIIKRLFLEAHKLPGEFSFTKYSMHLFKVFFNLFIMFFYIVSFLCNY